MDFDILYYYRMFIKIELPNTTKFLNGNMFPIVTCRDGNEWSENFINNYGEMSGLYIHHYRGKFLYVGITTKSGKWGIYKERFRREFLKGASKDSRLYRTLSKRGASVRTTLIPIDRFNEFILVKPNGMNNYRIAMLLEQALISYLKTTELNIR